jgi:hypothetical protein
MSLWYAKGCTAFAAEIPMRFSVTPLVFLKFKELTGFFGDPFIEGKLALSSVMISRKHTKGGKGKRQPAKRQRQKLPCGLSKKSRDDPRKDRKPKEVLI